MDKISFKLGVPEAGWLPVHLVTDAFEINVDASDVPKDPLEELISSIILLCSNVNEPPDVMWHLEPFCYYFRFKKVNSTYLLTILSSEYYDGPKKIEFEIMGTFDSIIMPIYRGIKAFASFDYKDGLWPAIEMERIDKLKRVVTLN